MEGVRGRVGERERERDREREREGYRAAIPESVGSPVSA